MSGADRLKLKLSGTNWETETFQSRVDWLPAGGVARGAPSPSLDGEMRGPLAGVFVGCKVPGTALAEALCL